MKARSAFIRSLLLAALLAAMTSPAHADQTPAERGYRLLTTKPYLPGDFDQQVFDELWKTWPQPLRAQAEKAGASERRKMSFDRYGLTSAPGDESGRPQQYVVDQRGNWTMNCLACHQGKVAGRVIPGAPNTLFALQTLTEEVRQTKSRLGKPLARMEIGSLFMPLGTSNGTTNAVMFGVALMARRDADLNVLPLASPGRMLHHDHDTPAWWLYKKKKRIYADGFALKGHRGLMQFMLVRENGPEKFREWEEDYRAVEAWIQSLDAPRYPFKVDSQLAAAGRPAFERHCSRCHGTYGPHAKYPERIGPIEEVGTDRTRLDALSSAHRAAYSRSWFTYYGRDEAVLDPPGYQAPPLDGIWASAPYLHNGSVPTLWHMLHPDQRPPVWLRTQDGYDRERVGLEITACDRLPAEAALPSERRRYFDTRLPGKSAAGHLFVNTFTESEKRAVLEYLKTL